jgi:hypothetical protein
VSAEVILVGLVAASAEHAQRVKTALEAKLPGREVVIISGCTTIALIDAPWTAAS